MKLENYAPLGLKLKIFKVLFITLMALALLTSFHFFGNLKGCYESIAYSFGKAPIIPEETKADCFHLMENCFKYFPLGIICSLLTAVYNYIYLFNGAKSIYTLKRLERKSELYKRVFFLPVLLALVFTLTGLLLIVIYYLIFITVIPEGWQAPDQLLNIWENLKWLI